MVSEVCASCWAVLKINQARDGIEDGVEGGLLLGFELGIVKRFGRRL